MSIVNGYATLDEYKAWMSTRGLSGDVTHDASDDSAIEIMIGAVSRYIDRETGRRFFADTNDATRYYTASKSDCIYVDPLASAPTSVSVDYSEGLRLYTTLSATEYDLAPYNALLDGQPYTRIEINLAYSAYLPLSARGVRVVGKFGYPSVPADIKEITLATVQNINSNRSGQAGGGRISVTDGGIVIRPEDLPSFAQRVIQHYRSMV